MKLTLPSRNAVRQFIVENKWIIFAAAFFTLWKIFLTYTLWEGRTQPPEWDDSYGYIDHIYSVVNCPSLIFCRDTPYNFSVYAGFDHLTYRLFWGGLARLLHLGAMTIFHWSFYIGIPMLVASLLFFLRRLTTNKKLIALSLFVLALYNGAGTYHGFFWVVPSFFAVILCFVLLGIILDRETQWKRWVPWIIVVVPLAVFTHIISFYGIVFLFPAFAISRSIFLRRIDWLLVKKVFLAAIIALACYLAAFTYVSRSVPYGPQAVATQIGTAEVSIAPEAAKVADITLYGDTKLGKILPGIGRFYLDYFQWVFRHWTMAVLFVAVILIVLAKKEYTILALYGATLSFTIAATISEFGFRALVLLWPVTFLLYAYGAWGAVHTLAVFLKKPWKIWGNILPAAALAGFALFNMAYSLYWNETENRTKNFHISDEAVSYIRSIEPDKTIALDSLIRIYLGFKGYEDVNTVSILDQADYLCKVNLDSEFRPLSKPAEMYRRVFTANTSTKKDTADSGGLPSNFAIIETFENVSCFHNTARM